MARRPWRDGRRRAGEVDVRGRRWRAARPDEEVAARVDAHGRRREERREVVGRSGDRRGGAPGHLVHRRDTGRVPGRVDGAVERDGEMGRGPDAGHDTEVATRPAEGVQHAVVRIGDVHLAVLVDRHAGGLPVVVGGGRAPLGRERRRRECQHLEPRALGDEQSSRALRDRSVSLGAELARRHEGAVACLEPLQPPRAAVQQPEPSVLAHRNVVGQPQAAEGAGRIGGPAQRRGVAHQHHVLADRDRGRSQDGPTGAHVEQQ